MFTFGLPQEIELTVGVAATGTIVLSETVTNAEAVQPLAAVNKHE